MKTIKTLVAVAFAALTLSLTGCSKDPEDLIIGSWEVTDMTFSMTSSATPDQPWTETITPENGESTVLTFKKDGTLTIVDTDADGTTTETGTYDVDDDKLTMTYKDEDGDTVNDTFTITTIDKKKMTLNESATGTEEGVTYTESLTINLKKK